MMDHQKNEILINHELSRRALVRSAVGVAGVAGLGPSVRGAAASARLQGEESGGTLRFIQLNDVAPREPHLRLSANGVIMYTVWDTLTLYDGELTPQPMLAESWEWSEDSLSLTVRLRQGVKFHSGRDFTAEDVEFNIVRVREPAVGSQMRSASEQIKRIERPDTHTIVLGFDFPYLAIFDMFETLVILDQETIDGLSQGNVIGTGPFLWSEWTPNTKLILERNESYWQDEQPLLDRVELTIAGDVQALTVQLEAEQQDVALAVPAEEFVRLREDPRFETISNEAAQGYWYLAADVTTPPLDNAEVRKALHYGIDRERIVRAALGDVGKPAVLPWPEGSPAFDAELNQSFEFDLDRAKDLLSQAGVGEGFDMPITINSQRLSTVGKIVQVIQADFAEIGVNLEIKTMENTVFQRTLNESSFGGLFSHGHGASTMTPVSLFLQAFPFRKENSSNFTSPEYTRLIDAMVEESDPTELQNLYEDMNQLLLDEAFILDIATNPPLHVSRPAVQELRFSVTDWWIPHRTSIS